MSSLTMTTTATIMAGTTPSSPSRRRGPDPVPAAGAPPAPRQKQLLSLTGPCPRWNGTGMWSNWRGFPLGGRWEWSVGLQQGGGAGGREAWERHRGKHTFNLRLNHGGPSVDKIFSPKFKGRGAMARQRT